MFFSVAVLFAVSLGAVSVLATPHALHHNALHRRAAAVRVAPPSNSSDVAVKRQMPQNTPSVTSFGPSPTASIPTPSPSTGSASVPYTGQGTFFAPGLGACGINNADTDFIVAISTTLWFATFTGSDPNDNPLCSKQVTISYQGKTATAIITDKCLGCAIYDLDMTPSLFEQFAGLDIGRIYGVEWTID